MLTIVETCIDANDDNDWRDSLSISVVSDTAKFTKTLNFSDGEPEDNNCSRNFADVYGIVDLLKIAYEAGKNGEDITIRSPEPSN